MDSDSVSRVQFVAASLNFLLLNFYNISHVKIIIHCLLFLNWTGIILNSKLLEIMQRSLSILAHNRLD